MQHKMVKAFENIVISYDGSVRNTIGTLFSPLYNSGYDVGEMMMVENKYSNEFSSFIDIKSLAEELNVENGWVPKDFHEKVVSQRNKIYPTEVLPSDNCSVEESNSVPVDDFKESDIIYDEPLGFESRKINDVNDLHVHSITKFEKSRIIGARSIQLLNGAKPIINITPAVDVDPIDIALKEYDTGNLKIYIVRKATDRTSQKIFPTKDNQLY
jgi:DNA-directed RNA polymerase subunit K/omega